MIYRYSYVCAQTTFLFLIWRYKKKSLGDKLGLFVRLADQKGADMCRCVKVGIVMVNNDLSSLVRFSNFYEDFRQTNCEVPLRIDHRTMLKWNSRHKTSFDKETTDHLIRSYFSINHFGWIWLGFEDQQDGLLFCFGLIRIVRIS